MQPEEFVHLHIHSEYSLLDGSIKVKKLVKELSKRGARAAALTDHDGMHGVLEFFLSCQAEKINGIIGYEINVETILLEDKKQVSHLILLAENNEGYANLIKLCTIANTTGKNNIYPDSTSVTIADLQKYSKGIICLTSCMKGELSALILKNELENAAKYLNKLTEIFGNENTFVELIDNGIPEQKRLIPNLIKIAKQNQVEIVATADVHYINKQDKETHMSLLAIKHKLQKSDVRGIPSFIDFHLPTFEEMQLKFSKYPEAISNTKKIADRCDVKIDTKSIFMPDYRQRENETSDDCLVRLSRKGLEARKSAVEHWMGKSFNEKVWDEYKVRLEYELSVILKMKFSGYFLIVQDFINWAKEQKIPVGPGRGSAAGSIVTYALRITNIDPIRFNLLFERFLNPDRISMPDIDTDFCQDRRGDVLNYVYQKYGNRAVSQIVTFGRMMAKNALKNLARINGWLFHESNEFAKLIPESPGITLEQAFKEEIKIQERIASDERAKNLWESALEVEGTLSSLGIHAAGVIISDRALDERCPLLETDGQLLTQFENKYAEKIGLIKFDFLGLKTLTVIDNAVKISQKRYNINIDIDSIELEDPKVYEMISTAHVTGIFQLESNGMRKLIANLKPTCFTDIIAVLALFRPGPLGSGMVDDFVKRKHGETQVEYPFEELEPILSDTYGVIVYQEQVQKIAAVLANYTLGEADLLRRAMGKKDKNEMERQKSRFVSGATENGHNPEKAADLFDLMAKFAEYGFNKSHTAAYGWVTYQTAWLKTYYPTEFMTAIMTCDLDNTDKIVGYVRDCKRMKIAILPPCVNHSRFEFSIPDDKIIQFGLGAIKGLGSGIINMIVEEREKNGIFGTVPEFIARLDARKLNKKVMESLIKAGAFDSIASNRAELMTNSDTWLKTIAKETEREENTSFDIFGMFNDSNTITKQEILQKIEPTPKKKKNTDDFIFLPNILPTIVKSENCPNKIANFLIPIQIKSTKPWTFYEQLAHEFATLGFYMTGHPADLIRADLKEISEISLNQAILYLEPDEVPDYKRKAIKVAGIVTMNLEKKNKDGNSFLILKIEDGFGELEVTLFSKQYAALTETIKIGEALVVECKIKKGIEDGSVKGIVQSIDRVANKRIELVKRIILSTEETFLMGKENIKNLINILIKNKGKTPLYMNIAIPDHNLRLKAKMGNHYITPTDNFIMDIENTWPGLVKVERVYHYQVLN
ncbi:DNA polymerase III subunit alpha [Fluviispira multicolorata]|uniref:DNA polymerase III subunit alpha n=1 Tax=Fluviispira multicolorata TaxID=2654512 RepID=A0A833JDQ1_9BACT|nr:DNA polymerase III subunit alpha [Fluviispira multicolorata]KAB8029111.1 DNA polymerase III subunit alpha [Fluviispira multicolorata]